MLSLCISMHVYGCSEFNLFVFTLLRKNNECNMFSIIVCCYIIMCIRQHYRMLLYYNVHKVVVTKELTDIIK